MIVCKADYCGIVCLPINTVTTAVKAHKVYHLRLCLKYTVNIIYSAFWGGILKSAQKVYNF